MTHLGPAGLAIHSRPGPGPTILWLHGYTLDSTIWRGLWSLLPEFGHVGIDLPGHGGSPGFDPKETRQDVGRRLGRVAEEAGAHHLVSLSFGTLFAVELLLRAPGSFETVTLAAPTFVGAPVDQCAQSRNIALERLFRARGAGRWMTELWMSAPPEIFTGAMRHPSLAAQLSSLIDRHQWTELVDDGLRGILANPQPLRLLAACSARTLILTGEEEMPAFRRAAHLLNRAIPASKAAEIAGTGHLCLIENPEIAAALIRNQIGYSPLPCSGDASHAAPGVT